jgi:hypothetical protein
LHREESKTMPARANHLPAYFERIALQKLRLGHELSARDLEPTSKRTLKKLMAKGWLEGGNAIGTYRITRSGEEALSAPLPRRINAAL